MSLLRLCLSCSVLFSCALSFLLNPPPSLNSYSNPSILMCDDGISFNNTGMNICRLGVDQDSLGSFYCYTDQSWENHVDRTLTTTVVIWQVSWPFRGGTHERWKQRFSSDRCCCYCHLHEVINGGRCCPLSAGLVKAECSRGRKQYYLLSTSPVIIMCGKPSY